MQKSYALFDFDGTLIRGDSIVRLCLYAHRKKQLSLGGLARAGLMAALYLCKLTTAEKSKQAALGFLEGWNEKEMRAFAEAFCREVLVPRLYKDGVAEIKKHRKAGAEVWLISASPAFYLFVPFTT